MALHEAAEKLYDLCMKEAAHICKLGAKAGSPASAACELFLRTRELSVIPRRRDQNQKSTIIISSASSFVNITFSKTPRQSSYCPTLH